ncbi:D-glucuronyl C5-epimerase family protein [Haloplanus rubicundus]|nr:D-glucuronyl C5-epimerase family protein [Haloplanus rubicundus]
MGLWLLDVQLDTGAFPGGVNPDPNADPSVFNTGQILLGLVRAYDETGDERYISAAVEAANWLVAVQHEDGYWDQYDYRDEIHTYCSRVAWALLEVEQQIGGASFHRAAINHLDWVLSNQTNEYWFNNAAFSPGETPFLHTIAYTVRGILECGILLDNDTYINAAKRTADQLFNLQKESGVLAGAYDKSWIPADFNCLTGNAQTALIWLRLADRYEDTPYTIAADREIEFLKTHHILANPGPLYGGLTGSVPVWDRYLRLRVPNWAVKFFIDALLYRSDS